MEVLGGGCSNISTTYNPGERPDNSAVYDPGGDGMDWCFRGSVFGSGDWKCPIGLKYRWRRWERNARYLRRKEQLGWECSRLMTQANGVIRIEKGCLRKECGMCAKWLGSEKGNMGAVPLAVQIRWVTEFFEGLYYQ